MRTLNASHFALTIVLAAAGSAMSACGDDTTSNTGFHSAADAGGDGLAGASSGAGGLTAGTGGAANGSSGGSGGLAAGGGSASGGMVGAGGGATGGATGTGGGTAGASPGDGGPTDASVADAGDTDGSTTGTGGAGGGDAGASGCATSFDCTTSAPFCDAATGACIACQTDVDCQITEECTGNACVPLTPCTNSLDCQTATDGKTICDPSSSACVECIQDGDCAAAEICRGRVCLTGCNSDNDCVAQNQLCDLLGGVCANCVRHADCAAGQYCSAGTCVPDVCVAGTRACQGNLVVECNATGNDVATVDFCAGRQVCIQNGTDASCGAPPPDAGGGAGGAGTGGAGSGGSSSGGGAGTGGSPGTDGGAALCTDNVQDGSETDTDCGGPDCPPCGTSSTCNVDGDCRSQVCALPSGCAPFCGFYNEVCQAPSCSDGVQNGTESDVDCGGGSRACVRCDGGQSCNADTDCDSGTCTAGTCTARQCTVNGCPSCWPFARCCTAQDTCGCNQGLGCQ